ncbi:MAG: homoserine kinase [Anaerolineae bacterium]|jgi:Ser/Thr protein kinase RdoA (MazF antagonist)|nr:homoserine kinase [Anaerolineae bacterium]
MTSTNSLTETDLTAILEYYSLGTYLHHEPLTAGSVETNIRLKTTSGDFVFRWYENRSYESVLFECAVIEHLTQQHYPCPRLFRSRSGDAAGIYGGKPYVLFAFIEGEHLEHPNEEQLHQLIEHIAKLHRLTEGFQPPHIADRWNYTPERLVQLAEAQTLKIGDANARQKLIWYKREIANLQLPPELPRGVVHGDFHFSNILFENGQFKALIDFDDANYTVLLFDVLAVTEPFISSFDHDTWPDFSMEADVFDLNKLRKVLDVYTRIRPINAAERRHLFDVCKLMVLVDCLWFYARGRADDFYERRKIHYLNQLGRDAFEKRLFGE